MAKKVISTDNVPTMMGLEEVVDYAASLGYDVTTWMARNAVISGDLPHYNHRESGRRIFARADVRAWLLKRGA